MHIILSSGSRYSRQTAPMACWSSSSRSQPNVLEAS